MNRKGTSDAAPKDPLIEAIRGRVSAYIAGAPGHEGMSLRELSRRIGMSASGLMKFATGSMPYTPTRRKLLRWYRVLEPATRNEQKRDGLALLLAGVPPRTRAEAEQRVLEVLAEYEAAPRKPAGGAAGAPTPRPAESAPRRGRRRTA